MEVEAYPAQVSKRLIHHAWPPRRRDRIGERQRKARDRTALHGSRESAQFGDQWPRALQEADRLRSEPHSAPIGLDHGKPHRLLQRANALAHRGLSESQSRGGLGHGAELFQRDKGFDGVQHIPIPTVFYFN